MQSHLSAKPRFTTLVRPLMAFISNFFGVPDSFSLGVADNELWFWVRIQLKSKIIVIWKTGLASDSHFAGGKSPLPTPPPPPVRFLERQKPPCLNDKFFFIFGTCRMKWAQFWLLYYAVQSAPKQVLAEETLATELRVATVLSLN